MTVDGIISRVVETPRLTVSLLEREGDDPATPQERTVVLLHGEVGSARIWREFLEDLPQELRALAVDLRGFGGSENAPVDATRGVRDFSDDLAATLDALGLGSVHLVGWSLGGGVALQYALDHPVRSVTLLAPVSPYGFGGTRRDGSRLTDDDAGVGAGASHEDFARRLAAGDRGDDAATSPLTVFRESWVGPAYDGRPEELVLDAYQEAGGDVVELALEQVGHTPHLEAPAAVRRALLQRIGYVGPPAQPGLATEAVVLRSSD